MAAPMRDSPLDGGHRAKVADPRTAAAAKAEPAASNFEYDDNEWDIGIGDLIIDLDADIEKTNEKIGGAGTGGTTANSTGMSSTASGAGGKTGKMAVEHSATVDKGLKMKIKRTKPGTKTSEAKHEIVKPGEQNGGEVGVGDASKGKHPPPSSVSGAGSASGANNSNNSANSGSAGANNVSSGSNNASNGGTNNSASSSSKRGSSGHRRDKAREKHGGNDKTVTKPTPSPAPTQAVNTTPDVNGVVRPPVSTAVTSVQATVQPQQQTQQQQQTVQQAPATPQAPPPQQQRVVFPVSSGPGPPAPIAPNAPGPPSVAATAPAAAAAATTKPEPPKVVATTTTTTTTTTMGPVEENRSTSPPPAKKIKTSTEPKKGHFSERTKQQKCELFDIPLVEVIVHISLPISSSFSCFQICIRNFSINHMRPVTHCVELPIPKHPEHATLYEDSSDSD
ncbi:hypothetical protein L9F63_001621, partial [Diploptera punctata]